VIIGPIFSRD